MRYMVALQVAHVLAAFSIPDHLAGGPMEASELAQLAGTGNLCAYCVTCHHADLMSEFEAAESLPQSPAVHYGF